jgi:hypothetical protein
MTVERFDVRMVRDDGGRAAAGHNGSTHDCVTRAIAIIAERPYGQVYDELAELNARMRKTKGRVATTGKHTASHGIYTTSKLFKDYMAAQGFVWTPTMGIGTGCKVHLHPDELPKGRLIVAIRHHYTAVIDGVLHDTHDCTRGGKRCVYGYWRKL